MLRILASVIFIFVAINGQFSLPLYRRKFFLIVAQQFEVGVVVFLEANYSSVLLYLKSILSDISVLCS